MAALALQLPQMLECETSPPWTLTDQPFGRSSGAPQRRCRAWQGLGPLPARGALLRNTTGALKPTISSWKST